ncbi:1-aminocyclopropane-1-carboxylate oxidase-like 1 [Quillaja saponaria]|uniref:1-aminocyclopropane-1-carboxylate oxidase-like 1 n=1 Tax=Quillaja saponaria TaxID=32244 RepID=A0AAD7P5T2_QUISA|nr:1-aminocyclopropane-1-carboxylate oxidase-like 1 [Quillaja saponaria]
MAATTADSSDQYDRTEAVKQFDDSKIGVKGLVDSGIDSIPRFFIHPPETLSDLKPVSQFRPEIPTVDLSAVDSSRPPELWTCTINSIKAFHEQPTEIKARVYRRETGTGVSFISNVDLYNSKAASWRDTLQLRLGPTIPDQNEIPEICRDQAIAWDREIQRLGEVLMGLLSEGLGLNRERLKEMTCLQGRVMVGHYYPKCPQPDLTVGLTSHTDPGVLTVLLQDHIGGLQVRCNEGWADVKPVPGALVINIGDLLQIISNEEYKSVDHRVLANPSGEPRVSIAVFFNPGARDELYGPLPELTSAEKRPLYRNFNLSEFYTRFFTKELAGKSLTNYFKQ